MHFTALLTMAVATALAAPQGNLLAPLMGGHSTNSLTPVGSSATLGQAVDSCGDKMQLNCCNKVDTSGDAISSASGILSGLLGGVLQNGDIGLFDQCSKLSVTALIGVDDILNNQCKQTAACCQKTSQSQSGLVNIGLPCVALGGLL